MRTTKVLAFSVPPELANEIRQHVKTEQLTLSEYLREAIKRYMIHRKFQYRPKRPTLPKKIKAKKNPK